ncbi:MAG: hypothetical protein NVS1B4_18570 [Gemmatimonadaceae bacterium]
MTRRRVTRLWLVLVACIQVAAPPLVSIADAAADASALTRGATAHVEAHRTAACPRVHPDQCALCRYITASGAPAARCDTIVANRQMVGAVHDTDRRAVAWLLGALPQSRGPPGSVV